LSTVRMTSGSSPVWCLRLSKATLVSLEYRGYPAFPPGPKNKARPDLGNRPCAPAPAAPSPAPHLPICTSTMATTGRARNAASRSSRRPHSAHWNLPGEPQGPWQGKWKRPLKVAVVLRLRPQFPPGRGQGMFGLQQAMAAAQRMASGAVISSRCDGVWCKAGACQTGRARANLLKYNKPIQINEEREINENVENI
jgi:hypothetical protein